VQDSLFAVEALHMEAASGLPLKPRLMQIVACLSGNLCVEAGAIKTALSPGEFCLAPACLDAVQVCAMSATSLLRVEAG